MARSHHPLLDVGTIDKQFPDSAAIPISGDPSKANLLASHHVVQMVPGRGSRYWIGAFTPEVAATTVRLLLAHLTWNSKRLLGAMVLDRLDAESLSTRADFPDRCQRLVNGLDSVNGLNP